MSRMSLFIFLVSLLLMHTEAARPEEQHQPLAKDNSYVSLSPRSFQQLSASGDDARQRQTASPMSLHAAAADLDADLGLTTNSKAHFDEDEEVKANMLAKLRENANQTSDSYSKQHLQATFYKQRLDADLLEDAKMEEQALSKRKEELRQQLHSLSERQRKAHANVEELEGQMKEQYKLLKAHEERTLLAQKAEANDAAEVSEQALEAKRRMEDTEFAELEALTGSLASWFGQLKQFKEEGRAMMDAKITAANEAARLGFAPEEIAKASAISSKDSHKEAAQALAREATDSFAQTGFAQTGEAMYPPASPNDAPARAMTKEMTKDIGMKMAKSQMDVMDFNLAAKEFMHTAALLKAWNKKGNHDADSFREGADLQQQLAESLQAVQQIQERVQKIKTEHK